MKTLEELKESIANLQTKFEEIKAATPQDKTNEHMYSMMDYCYSMIRDVYSYADNISQRLYSHTSTSSHLPPISGPGQMNNVLKTLGMDKDYRAEQRVIYASKDRVIVEVEFKKNKES